MPYATVKDYKVDVKGNALLIYTADQDMDTLAGIVCNPHASREEVAPQLTVVRWPCDTNGGPAILL
jgi:hypothetical protein